MPETVLWFALVLMAMAGAWLAGRWAARCEDPIRRGCMIGGAVTLLLLWAALIRHPTVAVQLIPAGTLARLEGVGAAPLFMFIVSVGWYLSSVRRQRAVMVIAVVMGFGYFLQGGLWMTKPTPTRAFSERSDRYLVEQTQDYSCVPAASATALRILGIRTSEAEMAELTKTRAGMGATLLRAFNGLEERLALTEIKPVLLQPDYEQLRTIKPPILTPLSYEPPRLHMVTILEVRDDRVLVADPQMGLEFLSRRGFESRYRGQVIAFEGDVARATTRDVLAQHRGFNDTDAARRVANQTQRPEPVAPHPRYD